MVNATAAEILRKLPRRRLAKLLSDPERSAKAVELQYVSDRDEGIKRRKRGRAFCYYYQNQKIKDPEILGRIKSLVIPPAWKNVWICYIQNGHLQATGLDARMRKQYRYHPYWNLIRNHAKYYRLLDFGKALPAIRQKLEHDLSLPGMPREKVSALVVRLIKQTNIRVGMRSCMDHLE